MPGKLAFLFLTKGNHSCEVAWNLFFKNVDVSKYSLYNHPKSQPTQPFLKNNIIHHTTPTQWGDISLVKATLLLLQAAYTDTKNSYFILVSDSCIPVVDFQTLYYKLHSNNKSYLYYRHIGNRLDRYQKLSAVVRNKLAFHHFYSQHQWMILYRPHVKLAIDNNLISDFRWVHACDEHYFVSLFYLLGVLKREFINQKTTYCDWSDVTAMHPKTYTTITKAIINTAHRHQTFFIRKIANNCNLCHYLSLILQLKDN